MRVMVVEDDPRVANLVERTLAEAREIGLSMPEALDLTREEIESWL